MSIETALEEHFPGALNVRHFVWKTYWALEADGFNAENTIACVGVCRDEITRPLSDEVHHAWGEAFSFASLAGMLTLGRTGFTAARHHAPHIDDRERFVFMALPHIGINAEGTPGLVRRRGQGKDSSACGALEAFRAHIRQDAVRRELDLDDPEQSMLERRLAPLLPQGDTPSLVELTRLAQRAIAEDLDRLIASADMEGADYAVLSGVQIHTPEGDHVWPADTYAVTKGQRRELPLSARTT